MRIFAAWVRHIVRGRPRFFDPRNHLTTDRVLWVAARDQVEKVRRDRQREFVARQQDAAPLLIAEVQVLFELSELSDSVLKLPFPIVPEFWRGLRPITRRIRDELFPVPFF